MLKITRRHVLWITAALAIVLLLPLLSAWVAESRLFPPRVRLAAYWVHAVSTSWMENRNVVFYGKVVDQTGAGVGGAVVKFNYGVNSTAGLLSGTGMSPEELSVVTEPDGRFQVRKRIAVLEVKDIRSPNCSFEWDPEGTYHWYFDSEHPTPKTGNADAPIELKVWRSTEPPERLWDISIGSPSADVAYPGGTFSMFLTTSSHHSRYACVLPGQLDDADLWITIDRGPYQKRVGKDVACDWSYKVIVPHGGLQKAQPVYYYLAPEAGYERETSWEIKAADPGWKREAEPWFYVKAREGKLYAVVHLGLSPAVVDVCGYANLNGSRNLQPGGGFLNH